MHRREFLLSSTAALAVGTVARNRAQGADPNRAKLDRIAIMSYSFDRIMKNGSTDATRTLDLMDLPEMYADKYKVHNIEVQHNQFLSTETSYIREFLAKVTKAKSRITNINLEFDGMFITAPSPVSRAQGVDLSKRWIDHAVTLGSPRVMVNQGSPTPENKAIAIEALKNIGAYGKSKKVMVAMEPRGGGGGGARRGAPPPDPNAPAPPPPPPAYILLTEIIRESGTYANVDIGNFGGSDVQQAGIRAMFPYTDGNTHVKINPARYDLPAALKIIREEFKYTGLFSIEAGLNDPYANVQAIYDVLLASI